MREPGFYWVKVYGKWQVAEYLTEDNDTNCGWDVVGSEQTHSEMVLQEIDERQIINPNNPVRGDEESAESFMDRLKAAGLTEKEHCCGACKDGHKCESDGR